MENYKISNAKKLNNQNSSAIEGGRRPTEMAEELVEVAGGAGDSKYLSNQAPKSEVIAKKPRKKYSGEYKLRILRELDSCKSKGEKGLIMRREGLYSSTVSGWRKQSLKKTREILEAKRGRKSENPSSKRISELEIENEKLRKKLKHAEAVIDIQKKVSGMFGMLVEEVNMNAQK
jgi:transposase